MKSIRNIAEAVNAELGQTAFDGFYERRARRLGKKVHVGPLFHTFSTDADDDFVGWAIHYGGRGEMQFNLGIEDGRYFRYGVAFSLEASRSLPDPVGSLRALIDRFNAIVGSFNFPDGVEMWWFEDGVRSRKNAPPGPIAPELVRNKVFVFLGAGEVIGPQGAEGKSIRRAAEVLISLLPLYDAVHTEAASVRVARMCWNSLLWQKPSGTGGKSSDENSFEAENGFGHEEWNFATTHLIDGWKYGFLQAFNNRNSNYLGKPLTLLLYAIDGVTKARYWVGQVENVEVLTPAQSQHAKAVAQEIGLIESMCRDVVAVGLSAKTLRSATAPDLFNIRYRLDDIRIFDSPVQFDAKDLGTPRYVVVQRVPESQAGLVEGGSAAEQVRERNIKALKSFRRAYVVEKAVDLVHKQWQLKWRDELPGLLPGCEVFVEKVLGNYSVDLLVAKGGRKILFELKTTTSVRQAIREALSQLLEYAYWPPGNEDIEALVVVGAGKAGASDHAYIQYLRDRHGLPLHYLHCSGGNIQGIGPLVSDLFSKPS